LKAITKSGVLKVTDTFGCRHLGVMQLFCMSAILFKHYYLNEGEFLHGKKCGGSTCTNMLAETILWQNRKTTKLIAWYCTIVMKVARQCTLMIPIY
jgi:hypothetical protein